MTDADTFPRQYARTQRLTLGEPRTLTVSADGRRVAFVRSRGGSDPVNCLWVLDVLTGAEQLVADPLVLLAGDDMDDLPPAERARRERAREGAGGVVAYATDGRGMVAAFALAGRLFVAGLVSATARELEVTGPVFDPRPDPQARRVAYVCGRSLRIAELDGSSRELAGTGLNEPTVSWGSAEFVAAEEMNRGRGYWWSPDGERLAVTRVDVDGVQEWHIADPANPATVPAVHRYPAAGTPNAQVHLFVIDLAGHQREVTWDRVRFEYLANVAWSSHGLHLVLQTRDQGELVVMKADPDDGTTAEVFVDRDQVWVELVGGTPNWLDDGRLVMAADWGGARRLVVAGLPVTPPDVQIRAVLGVQGTDVIVACNPVADATVQHVAVWNKERGLELLTRESGVHTAWVGGSTIVVRRVHLGAERASISVLGGTEIANHAETPLVHPNVTLLRLGPRRLATALLLPHDAPADARLPVLLDPYGGPHAQRVVASRAAYLSSQWFADQGYAVVVTDGRGTPGRGSEWERSVRFDLAGPVLEDQIDALHAVAADHPQLDLGRVAIRGWSFGGYLAALAVLRRPDVFHAAIAGAPVTEWRLYDTHYTERYLGNPSRNPAPYDRASLLSDAARLERPLLMVHGLADDNVVAAHTLQLSSALLAAGRPHQVLPLSGVTHMTPQEVVAENLLLLQLAFLADALAR